MTLSAKDIIQEFNKRKGRSVARLAVYAACESAYYGEDQGIGAQKSMDGYGRPIQRLLLTRDELSMRGGAPNMILPVVDDRVAQRGRIPQMRVLPWQDDDESRERARSLSRVLRTQWLQSNMIVQAPEAAWYLSTKGDVLYTLSAVYPDSSREAAMTPPGVYITVVDPTMCFPRFSTGWNRYTLEDVIVHEQVDMFAAKEQWNVEQKGDDYIDVYHYIGKDYNCIVVRDQEVSRVDHGLGFCPAEWIRNKALARYGQSDIVQALDLHREYQVMFLVMSDSLVESTYSQLVIVDPQSTDEQFETGPGAEPIVVKQGGNVFRLQPNEPPRAALMIMNTAWEQLTRMTESTPIRSEGQIGGSNISGRAISAVQGPQQERVALQQIMLGHHYEHVNSMIMRMFYDLDAFKHAEMAAYGSDRNQPFVETFTGEDFHGWTRNEVRFGSPLGTNSHERSVVALNLHDKHLITGRRVLEEMEVDEPERELAAAKEEFLEEARQMQALQSAPSPQGGSAVSAGGGPGGSPPAGGQPGPSLQQPPVPADPAAGGQGAGPLPPFDPTPVAPGASGEGAPSPLSNMGERLANAQRLAAFNMRGEIVNAAPIPGGVMVDITDSYDKAIVRNAYHKVGFQEVRINVVSGAKA